MKRSICLFVLLIFNAAWSQNDTGDAIQLKPELSIAFVSHIFLGNNYLSKGHKKKPTLGALLKMNLVSYRQLILGIEYEKSTTKVNDFAIGGNIDKTNINSFRGLISYRIKASEKLTLDPQLKYGTTNLRQKNGSKFYGNQQGSMLGIGFDVTYNLIEAFDIFTNIGYNYYRLHVNTTPEFEDYFNHAQSFNITIGLKIN